MPEGTAIPETTTFNFYVPDGVYERGMGYGLVSWTWLCATETTLLDALEAGDDAAADAVIAQLDLWVALPSEQRMIEGVEEFHSFVLDPAKSGDTSALEADQKTWCAQAPFETT